MDTFEVQVTYPITPEEHPAWLDPIIERVVGREADRVGFGGNAPRCEARRCMVWKYSSFNEAYALFRRLQESVVGHELLGSLRVRVYPEVPPAENDKGD